MRRLLPSVVLIALAGCVAMPLNGVQPVQPQDGAYVDWMLGEFGPETRYRSGNVDLDGDGIDETLIWTDEGAYCGTGGCGFYIMQLTSEGEQLISRSTITRVPIGVLDSSTNGMRDIAVTVGGGGEPAGIRVLRYDGARYPLNPTVDGLPADDIGDVVISEGPLRPLVRATGPITP